jgi:hypothetical protein
MLVEMLLLVWRTSLFLTANQRFQRPEDRLLREPWNAEKWAENEFSELIFILKATLKYKYVTNDEYLTDTIKVL